MTQRGNKVKGEPIQSPPYFYNIMEKEINYKESIDGYYLCGIGQKGIVKEFKVGRGGKRDSFYFDNGSYSPMELFLEPVGSNATYVVLAIPLSDIDDEGIFDNKL